MNGSARFAVTLLAAVLVPVLWTAPEWLGALGLDPSLLNQGRGYTQVMALTLAPMLGVACYRTILTAAEKPKVFLWVTLAMMPVNAAANYVLMTGIGRLSNLRSGNSARSGSRILAFPLDIGLGVRGPFFVDLDEDGGDEALESVVAGKDPDLDGAALELLLDRALHRV